MTAPLTLMILALLSGAAAPPQSAAVHWLEELTWPQIGALDRPRRYRAHR